MRFLTILTLGVLVAAVAFGLNLVPFFQQTGVTQVVLRVIILALVLFGLWRGLTATGMQAPTRGRRWLTVAIVLVAWAASTLTLAIEGVFDQSSRFGLLLPLVVLLPLITGLPLLLRSSWLGQVLDVTPPAWLVGLQVYRVFGSVWIVAWATGVLPGAFALPAGIGDTLVGILAMPVAGSANRAGGVGWNLLGILDLADAFILGTLVLQGQFPYPLVLIPTFAVPLSILFHAVSLRQLRRGALSANPTNRASTTSPAGVLHNRATPAS